VPGPRLAEGLGLVHDAEDAREAGGGEASARPAGASRKKARADRPATPLGLVEAAIALLNQQYQATSRSFRIERIAGGYRVMTLPAFAPALEAFHGKRERHALSRAAVETLAIIAYKQPITRAALESIRGVACGEVLRSLMERRLVTIVGRAEELGRPMLYGTSKAFLETFGLSSVKDLPSVTDLKAHDDGDD
jgi:segregation and condensation protein B